MGDMGIGEALIISSLITAATTATTSAVEYHEQEKAMGQQAEAQAKAEEKQKAADEAAEKKRLEALAANQTATDYGNIWGTDTAKYSDAAQKLSAGTGSFNKEEEETNPFYTRGLL